MEVIDVFVDLDDTFLGFTQRCNEVRSKNPEIKYPQSLYRFYAELEPLKGAVEALLAIERDQRYKVWFCTAPSIKNRLCYTEKADSIHRILGEEWLERLFIAPDKSKMTDGILIDDSKSGRGQETYRGELIHFLTDDFPNWASVLDHLGVERPPELADF
ncbi:hypothetical protein [Vibrio sp. D431a]|uniref:hypothetical protein n=1 Tax=Vibrio sp. D431a TaxID=2837388 RepID=UPI0025552424|nr:hypothetical protein [Vibrio sp. D431a]MDK9790144.1 hypothetical protein [Vibrio sp. D431a]